MSAGKAVLVGHIIVNLPVVLVIIGFLWVGRAFFPDLWFILFVVGFILAWTWWSFSVPRWLRWALERGAPADRLQKLAVLTGLVWPKGWLPERTEMKLRDTSPSNADRKHNPE